MKLEPPPYSQPPRWETPGGDLWVHQDLSGRPLLIRRIPGDPGLLKVGIHLRHALRAEHPRMKVPSQWWREDGSTFLAQELPGGAPLGCVEFSRLTWTEALDAITPLAVALRDAHRRGMIHGLLDPWNVFFEPAALRLTAVNFGTWALEAPCSGPFCPPEFDCPPQDRRPHPSTDIHNLARLMIFLALSPEESLRPRPNFETLPAFAIPTLEAAIQPDISRRPSTIDEFLAGLAFHQKSPSFPTSNNTEERTPASTDDDDLLGRVSALQTFENKRRGEGIRFLFHPAHSPDSLGFFLYREQAPAAFADLLRLWDGAELRILRPRRIADTQGRTFLTADSETLFILEPFWPVSVSDVLKAQGCPQRVLVDLRDPGPYSHHLPFGNLIHAFLEDLTADETLSYQDLIQRRLPPLRLDFLAAGVDDEKLQSLLDDGRTHYENIRRFTARRTHSGKREDRVGWCGEHVEATRYSARYGLEGRSDLVVADHSEGLQIIELKSGKAWHEHPGQVQSYALLWEEMARSESMTASGFLLYSKTGRMTPVPLDQSADLATLMEGRNGLIALYHSIVEGHSRFAAPYFMEEPELCRQGACRFRKPRCKAQTALLGLNPDQPESSQWSGKDADLVSRARFYHHHLTALIEMERWTDHRTLGAILSPSRLPERIADGVAASDLTLEPVDGDRRRIRLRGPDLHIFSPGDRILLHREEIDTSHLLRAVVLESDEDAAGPECLEVLLSAGTLPTFENDQDWIADILPARIGYRTSHRALHRLLEKSSSELLATLLRPADFGQQQEDFLNSPSAELPPGRALHSATLEGLNLSQQEALLDTLGEHPATLIQGPPGTGKTTVIAHIALEHADRDSNLLLSALTNTAVDTMLIKLLDAALQRGDRIPPFLRLGSSSRSPLLADELRRRGLHPADYFSDDLARDAPSQASLARRLNQVQIVAATAHSALSHPAMTYFENERGFPAFDVALIDEASQLTEPIALAPISAARRFVLVGDHRQLPPIVTSERALSAFLSNSNPERIAPLLRDAGLAGLDTSLFERLANFLAPRMLTTQYRMNEAIMAYPAQAFYDGRLKAHPSVSDQTLSIADASSIPLAVDDPLVFVDIDGDDSGRANQAEAETLLQTALEFHRKCPESTLGVISPFRAQVHLLRRLFREAGLPPEITIDTVERFQGNERDVILVSLVKTDRPGDFLADARRLNVTLTRARKKLILFGRRECLQQDPTFRHWLQASPTKIVPWPTPSLS